MYGAPHRPPESHHPWFEHAMHAAGDPHAHGIPPWAHASHVPPWAHAAHATHTPPPWAWLHDQGHDAPTSPPDDIREHLSHVRRFIDQLERHLETFERR